MLDSWYRQVFGTYCFISNSTLRDRLYSGLTWYCGLTPTQLTQEPFHTNVVSTISTTPTHIEQPSRLLILKKEHQIVARKESGPGSFHTPHKCTDVLPESTAAEQRVIGNKFPYNMMIFICTMSAVPISNYMLIPLSIY